MSAKADKDADRAVNAHVGARIRDLRRSVKLTQRGLGDKVGLTPQQIQKYESGANGVSAPMMQRIATALNTSPNYFFRGLDTAHRSKGVGEPDGAAFVHDDAMTPEERELVSLIAHVGNPKAVRGLIDFIRGALDQGAKARR